MTLREVVGQLDQSALRIIVPKVLVLMRSGWHVLIPIQPNHLSSP